MSKERKLIKCNGMSAKSRAKHIRGNIIGETFEFVDVEAGEIVTLETKSCYAGSQCNKECYFWNLQPMSKQLFDASMSGHRSDLFKQAHSKGAIHEAGVWPCYLYACRSRDPKTVINERGEVLKCGLMSVFYKFISKRKLDSD